MRNPSLSVIMPILNEEQYLRIAAESVLRQEYDGEWELMLVLGPSVDKTNEIAQQLQKEFSRIVLVDNPVGKTTSGMNAAIALSHYEIVIRVDAHTELPKDYFKDSVEILMARNADLLGGVMKAVGDTPFQSAVAWGYNSRFGLGGGTYHIGGEEQEAESAYLGVFKKTALERVSGYDTNIIRGEDWDLAQRIKKTGGLIWFSPRLVVKYWPRASVVALARQFYSTGVWRGHLTRRSVKEASLRYFVPPMTVAAIVVGLMLSVFGIQIGLIPAVGYLSALVVVTLTARGVSMRTRVLLPIALATMHFSWGYGFIIGFIRGAESTLDRSRVTAK
jgi:glycosyltransferase involved in cell wall biosynthesis